MSDENTDYIKNVLMKMVEVEFPFITNIVVKHKSTWNNVNYYNIFMHVNSKVMPVDYESSRPMTYIRELGKYFLNENDDIISIMYLDTNFNNDSIYN
jgi:hypothetical protein